MFLWATPTRTLRRGGNVAFLCQRNTKNKLKYIQMFYNKVNEQLFA